MAKPETVQALIDAAAMNGSLNPYAYAAGVLGVTANEESVQQMIDYLTGKDL